MREKLLLFAFIIGTIISSKAQIFQKTENSLTGVMDPVACWIDNGETYKLKAYLSGNYYSDKNYYVVSKTNEYYTKKAFKSISTALPALYRGDAASADYDGDGDNDVVVTGITANNLYSMKLYKNNGGNRFIPINQNLTPVSDGSVEWGDFDNDDDLDILVTGKQSNNMLSTLIYRNDNGIFTQTNVGIPGIYNGNATWGDYDNDSDLDILITGNDGSRAITAVYQNDNNRYVKVAQNFIPLSNSYGAWGDFNNDTFLDFIVSGENNDGYPTCLIYENQSGTFFSDIAVSIRPLKRCTIDVGDFDNDNDLDILMTGESLERSYTNIYQNIANFDFENIHANLPGVSNGTAKWGDYDKDGDLDILLAGLTICYSFVGDIYYNSSKPKKKVEEVSSIFIDAPMPKINTGPYYYYVFSSCYCDPSGGNNNAYHMYISNIHLQNKRYELNYKFNNLLVREVPNWGNTDRGYRTSNGFATKREAAAARKQVIESYKTTNYTVHELNW